MHHDAYLGHTSSAALNPKDLDVMLKPPDTDVVPLIVAAGNVAVNYGEYGPDKSAVSDPEYIDYSHETIDVPDYNLSEPMTADDARAWNHWRAVRAAAKNEAGITRQSFVGQARRALHVAHHQLRHFDINPHASAAELGCSPVVLATDQMLKDMFRAEGAHAWSKFTAAKDTADPRHDRNYPMLLEALMIDEAQITPEQLTVIHNAIEVTRAKHQSELPFDERVRADRGLESALRYVDERAL